MKFGEAHVEEKYFAYFYLFSYTRISRHRSRFNDKIHLSYILEIIFKAYLFKI